MGIPSFGVEVEGFARHLTGLGRELTGLGRVIRPGLVPAGDWGVVGELSDFGSFLGDAAPGLVVGTGATDIIGPAAIGTDDSIVAD